MARLTVMHELHGELYMENGRGLFKFMGFKGRRLFPQGDWLDLGFCGEDRWLRRLREVRGNPDTVSWEVE